MNLEEAMRQMLLQKRLRSRINAELRRRGVEKQIVRVSDVAKAVHGRLKPGESATLDEVLQLVREICERRWGVHVGSRRG
jgi:hypothetical protein